MPEFFNPQPVEFGRTVTEKTPIAPADAGVAEGTLGATVPGDPTLPINKEKQGKV
jgi:hypothetical protein